MAEDERRFTPVDEKTLRELAERALQLHFDQSPQYAAERNLAGLRSKELMFSLRTDSRTFFVQDEQFGITRRNGVFAGTDDQLLDAARRIVERLQIPEREISERSVVREMGGAARLDPQGRITAIEEPQEVKRLATFARRVEGLPVWSSSMILGLTKLGTVGFLQLHWPEIPEEILKEARRLAAQVRDRWRPPERPGATVELVEAGIVHSPAMGFVMDVRAAIRVIYAATDPGVGRKPTVYVDGGGNEIPLPRQFEKIDEKPTAERPREVAPRDVIDRARSNFRALLLGNPNYFGTVAGSKLPVELAIQKDKAYEEIGCVGYEPQLSRLEAVVFVKRESGYGGGICSAGTPEYVRFFLSFDDGATWQDQGMSSFTAYDIPGRKPLEYDVTLRINPPRRLCIAERLPLVRAILSWNNPPPPNDPTFVPIWGEMQEARIQLAPRRRLLLKDLFAEAKLELPGTLAPAIDLGQEFAAAAPKALGVVELHALYKDSDVPQHRYLLPEVRKLVAQTGALALSGATTPAVQPAILKLGIDLGPAIAQLLATDGNTQFEELRCVGLNPSEDALIGVLTIKRPTGYGGTLCHAGSKEFVAFWVDYGPGWTYAGTTSVTVHDLRTLPSGGVQYAVFLPVDLSAHRRPCSAGAVTARVRAILSWETMPPSWNPDFVPPWGNREETRIHIQPGPATGAEQVPFLSAVGDVPQLFIDATGKATGAAIHTGFVASDSPFGGTITIAGHVANPSPAMTYRVMRKPHLAPDSAYVPLTNEPLGLALIVNTWDAINGWVQTPTTVHADADGYYPYEDYSSSHSVESDIMGRWFSTIGEDGQTLDLRIDLSTDGNPANDVHSNVVTVLVDNTEPDAFLDIDLGVGGQCADFDAGVTFTGTFSATDTYFGGFSFEIQPVGPAGGVLPTPASGVSTFYGGSISDPGVTGATYTLDATGMQPCGYALILHVTDRTNVNSGAGSHHRQVAVGFCLRAPQEDNAQSPSELARARRRTRDQ